MIGFTLQATQYDVNGELTYRTAILTLDTDADNGPKLDLRLVGGEDIFNLEVDEAWEAVDQIRSQLREWERKNVREGSK